jgi:hypothetical protein
MWWAGVRIYNAGFAGCSPAALRGRSAPASSTPAFRTPPRTGWRRCHRPRACSERCSASIRCTTCARATAPCTSSRWRVGARSPVVRSSRTSSPRLPRRARRRFRDRSGLLEAAAETIALVRGRGGHVGYVRVGFAEGEVPTGTMGRRIGAEVARTMFHAEAAATQIHDAVAPREGDIVVRKTRVGPFGTTDLCDDPEADVHISWSSGSFRARRRRSSAPRCPRGSAEPVAQPARYRGVGERARRRCGWLLVPGSRR